MITRQDAKVAVKTVLDQHLSHPVLFANAETVSIPDGEIGVYTVDISNETPHADGFKVPRSKTLGVVISCYGKDEESADRLYEELETVLESDPSNRFQFTSSSVNGYLDAETHIYVNQCVVGAAYVN
jgi:hypothetical protein